MNKPQKNKYQAKTGFNKNPINIIADVVIF